MKPELYEAISEFYENEEAKKDRFHNIMSDKWNWLDLAQILKFHHYSYY